MNKFFTLDDTNRRRAFEQTASKKNLPVEAIEKDFWVTEILNLLFTLPYADKMVFKGGTSLSKVWNLIHRFSEDIDIAVDRNLFGTESDLTKKQLKKLRKESSLFVKDVLAHDLADAVQKEGLSEYVSVVPEPDGQGDATYPEPRKIHIIYKSVLLEESSSYLRDELLLEVGARSLFEPAVTATISSFIAETFPQLTSKDREVNIVAAIPEKTFLEKAFLLHELFTTEGGRDANRKSRHLYDLYKMKQSGIAEKAIANDELWESIRHHREIFTSIRGVDYTPDIRKRICLIPPKEVIVLWRKDYDSMVANMIYDKTIPSFQNLLDGLSVIENMFHNR